MVAPTVEHDGKIYTAHRACRQDGDGFAKVALMLLTAELGRRRAALGEEAYLGALEGLHRDFLAGIYHPWGEGGGERLLRTEDGFLAFACILFHADPDEMRLLLEHRRADVLLAVRQAAGLPPA